MFEEQNRESLCAFIKRIEEKGIVIGDNYINEQFHGPLVAFHGVSVFEERIIIYRIKGSVKLGTAAMFRCKGLDEEHVKRITNELNKLVGTNNLTVERYDALIREFNLG